MNMTKKKGIKELTLSRYALHRSQWPAVRVTDFAESVPLQFLFIFFLYFSDQHIIYEPRNIKKEM